MSDRVARLRDAHRVTIDLATRAVVDALHAEIPELVSAMLLRLGDVMPEFDVAARPELADPVRRSCVAHLTSALAVVSGDRTPPSSLPTESLAETRVAILTGISMSSLAQNYRVCHSVLWERYMILAEGFGFPSHITTGVLRHGWRCLFAYSDRVVVLVSEEYERERERVLHASDERRSAYVQEILRGGWVAPEQLGYDLSGWHLAVIASGVSVGSALKELGRVLGCSLLAVAVDEGLHCWAWLGCAAAQVDVAAAAQAIVRAEGVCFAFGTPLEGLDGFRESKRQAELAARVAGRTGESVAFYADVALEALALTDEAAARRFMTQELGDLTCSGSRMATLRTTLLTYLQTSQNASSAAAVLGVHDRTVSYRLRSVVELLGRPISGRAAELSTALRIHGVLDGADVPEPKQHRRARAS